MAPAPWKVDTAALSVDVAGALVVAVVSSDAVVGSGVSSMAVLEPEVAELAELAELAEPTSWVSVSSKLPLSSPTSLLALTVPTSEPSVEDTRLKISETSSASFEDAVPAFSPSAPELVPDAGATVRSDVSLVSSSFDSPDALVSAEEEDEESAAAEPTDAQYAITGLTTSAIKLTPLTVQSPRFRFCTVVSAV
jgi:hypothetical protein